MATKSTEFNYKDCEKIDGQLVNAYVEASLDKENPAVLNINSTWGDNAVDLTDAVKAAETITRMELGSNAIEYFAEDGHVNCIYGDDLSRIISMHLLKDVDQTNAPTNGDVYMYDESKGKFVTFNLGDYMTNVANQISNLNAQIGALRTRVSVLEDKLTPPANVPSDVRVAFGTINLYGDYTGVDLKTSGIYTHDPTINKTNDVFME